MRLTFIVPLFLYLCLTSVIASAAELPFAAATYESAPAVVPPDIARMKVVAEVLAVILIGMLVLVVACMLYFRSKHIREHATIRLMIEKGLPIPPELLRPPAAELPPEAALKINSEIQAENRLKDGIFWLAGGVGLGAFFWHAGNGIWPLCLIAVVYGLATIGVALATRRKDP
jgi:hypothetical protein